MRYNTLISGIIDVVLLTTIVLLLIVDINLSGESSSTDLPAFHSPTTAMVNAVADFYRLHTDSNSAYSIAWSTVIASQKAHVPPFLTAAVVMKESWVNPQATGTLGEEGLMQIHPLWWRNRYPECGTDLYDINTNLCYGTKILALLLDREHGDTKAVLTKYNGSAVYADAVMIYMNFLEEGVVPNGP